MDFFALSAILCFVLLSAPILCFHTVLKLSCLDHREIIPGILLHDLCIHCCVYVTNELISFLIEAAQNMNKKII